MPAKSPSRPRNRLLRVLSQADFGLLQPHLEALPLEVRKSLEVPNLRIDDVYFPNAGIASVVAIPEKDTRVEVGLVGSEGMTGTSVVLGSDRSPNETYMQVAGEGQRITVSHLRLAMKASEAMHASSRISGADAGRLRAMASSFSTMECPTFFYPLRACAAVDSRSPIRARAS
jgi:hypothetical protein